MSCVVEGMRLILFSVVPEVLVLGVASFLHVCLKAFCLKASELLLGLIAVTCSLVLLSNAITLEKLLWPVSLVQIGAALFLLHPAAGLLSPK